jgi:hypothetical protein
MRAETDGHVLSSQFLQLLSMLTGGLPSNLATTLMQASNDCNPAQAAAAASSLLHEDWPSAPESPRT